MVQVLDLIRICSIDKVSAREYTSTSLVLILRQAQDFAPIGASPFKWVLERPTKEKKMSTDYNLNPRLLKDRGIFFVRHQVVSGRPPVS